MGEDGSKKAMSTDRDQGQKSTEPPQGGEETGVVAPVVGADKANDGAGSPAEGSPEAAVPPPASPGSQAPEGEVKEPKGEQAPKWAMDRIGKLTARLRAIEARGAGAPPPIDPNTGKQFTQEDIDKIAWERAQVLAHKQAFDAKCDEAAARGRAKYGDWQSRLQGFIMTVKDDSDPQSVHKYNLFLEAALETGEAEAIIHKLAQSPEEAVRIVGLSPMKMAMALGKLAEGRSEEAVSKLPKPIRPIGSTSPVTTTKPDDPERGHEIPISEWMARRDEQAKSRRIR